MAEIVLVGLVALGTIAGGWRLVGEAALARQAVVWIANVLMLVLIWLGAHLRGETFEHFGLSFRRGGARAALRTVLQAMPVLLAALAAFVAGSLLMARWAPAGESADMSGYSYLQGNLPMLVLALAAIYVVSSFGEEVIYRGFLMNRVAEITGGGSMAWASAVLVSSVAFGLVHFGWGIVGIVQTTLMGFALAVSFLVVRRNLWVLVLAHACIDSLLLIQLYAAPAAADPKQERGIRSAPAIDRARNPLEAGMTLPFAKLSFPELYEQALVDPLFRPWAELLVGDVELAAGDRVLDVACGTGIVARIAKKRLGEAGTVVGVDLNPAMLAVARNVAEDIDWREGDAADLPLRENEQFDVIVCQQGLQFLPDRAAAVRQMRRALSVGGRLAVSTWRPDEQIPFVRDLRRVAERRVGPITDRRHGFGEAGPLETLLREAGFRDVRSKTLTRTIRFADGSVFVRLNAMALVGMSAASGEMTAEERERFVAAIANDSVQTLEAYTDERGLAFELSTNVSLARA